MIRCISVLGLVVVAALAMGTPAGAQEAPLTVSKQGSFFVGGTTKTLSPGNDITVDQMYVQYQVPVADDSQPQPAVVLIHGCCLSAKSWERLCGEEGERHAAMGMEHCRVCAEACRRCEQAC